MISHRRNAKKSIATVTSTAAAHGTLGASTVVLALVASYVGCGGSTTTNPDKNSGDDAGSSVVIDSGASTEPADTGTAVARDSGTSVADAAPEGGNGAPSSTYPAFTPDVGLIVDNGGPVVANPVIVTVTWSPDTNAPTYDAFGDAIGASTYWSDINSEYGVGPATSGSANHISITGALPAYFDDQDLDSWVESHVGVDWPAQTPNTEFALYLPPGPPFYVGGPPDAGGQDVCSTGIGGYHTESGTKNYVYAVMPNCPGWAAGDIQLAASHELNEMSTDPHPDPQNVAWDGFDNNHLAMEFFSQFLGDELGDVCEIYSGVTDTTDFMPYTVQRQWSNKSAKAGHAWCVPALPEPFYNTTFLPTTQMDTITADLSALGYGSTTSKGFKMALNTTRTFPIGLFSDQATGGPFTLDVQGLTDPIAQDMNGNNIANGAATVTLDLTSGENGQIANVTVTPTAYSSLGLTFFYIRSILPSATTHHYLPILISQN
jgi:hypothetical protein